MITSRGAHALRLLFPDDDGPRAERFEAQRLEVDEALSRDFEIRVEAISERASHGASGGLGLGLYIVQQIVQAHEGSVDVASNEEDGTRFIVRLPRG